MSLRRSILILVLLFVCSLSFSQQGFLFVKKGFHKKRTSTEGDLLHVKLSDGSYRKGVITLLRNDTIYINGEPVWRLLVTKVLLEGKPKIPPPDAQTLLLIGAGVALTTAGITLSKQAEFEQALVAGLVIGYGPLVIKHAGGGLIRSFKRKKFKIGKKFRLQVLDFYFPQNKLKSF